MAPAAAAATALGVIIALSILAAGVFFLFIHKRKHKTKKEKYGGAIIVEQKPKPTFTKSNRVILATPLQTMEDNPFLSRTNSTINTTDAIVAEKQANAMRFFAQTKSIPNVLRTPSVRAGTTIEDENGRKAFTFNEIRAQPHRKPMRTLNEEDLNASVQPKLELYVPTEPLDLFENRRVSTDSGVGVVPMPNSVTMPSVNSRRASTQSNFITETKNKLDEENEPKRSHRRKSRRHISSDEESESESERRRRRKRSSRRYVSSDEDEKRAPKVDVERELPTPKEEPPKPVEPEPEPEPEPKPEEPKPEEPKPKRTKSRSKVTHEPVPVALVEEPVPAVPETKVKKRKSSKKNLSVE